MNLKKISAYTVFVNPAKNYFWIRLRLEETDQETVEVELNSLSDVSTFVDLLRNETNNLFDLDTQNLVVGWEPTGENSPNYKKNEK